MVNYLGTFEPMEDVVVELERLFMFSVWGREGLAICDLAHFPVLFGLLFVLIDVSLYVVCHLFRCLAFHDCNCNSNIANNRVYVSGQ